MLWLLAGCLALTLYFLYQWHFNYWSRLPGVPNIAGRIFGGKFLDLITLKIHFGNHLKDIYSNPKFAKAPVVGFYGLHRSCLLVRDPQLLKSIFIKDFDCFTHRYMQPDAKNDKLSSMMIVYARNPYWKQMRSKFGPFFSSGRLKQMYPLIQAVGNNLDNHLKRRGKRFVAEVRDICWLFAMDVSATTVFGVASQCLENPQEPINIETRRFMEYSRWRVFNHFIIHCMPDFAGLVRAKFFAKKSLEFVRSTVSKVLAERELSGQVRNDLIDIFIKLKEEARANNSDMLAFMDAMYAQAAQFWIAGFETSASAICHALMELAKQPELQDNLRDEIREYFAEGNGDITYESVHKLHYLHMVVQETMRLYPLLTFIDREYRTPKNRQQTYTLKPYYDFPLPEGMPVYVSINGIHYDEKYWPNPKKFDPERFSPSNRDKIQAMTYFPFGVGPRSCIGARLGLIETKIGLIYFLKNHCVRVSEKTVLQGEFDPKAVLLHIKDGIHLEVVRDDMCEKSVKS